MRSLIFVALAGLAGQLVDGATGMAFGVTSTTVLLASGIAPALASATVHLAEVGTTLASGVSHSKFGNVDWDKVLWLAVPGAVGGFVGANVLVSLDAEAAKPVVSAVLLALGAYILIRFAFMAEQPVRIRRVPRRLLSPLGLVAGFVDAVGGGGWGPIGSSTLLASARMEPRKVVGTIATSEFVVTVAASAGFLVSLGTEDIPFDFVLALLIGGAIAAPFIAWVVHHVQPRRLGTLVGGVLIITNTQTLAGAMGYELPAELFTIVVLAWILALFVPAIRNRRAQDQTAQDQAAEDQAQRDDEADKASATEA